MKLIKIIKACQQYDANAQRQLYTLFVDKLLNISVRYTKDKNEAKDVLHDGFIKIFQKISTYRLEESGDRIYPWMSRIIINEALGIYRKNKRVVYSDLTVSYSVQNVDPSVYNDLNLEDIKKVINTLPEPLRINFNLNVVDGYKHAEISKILGIKEASSRTRVSRAKAIIREQIIKINHLPCQKIN